MPGFGPAFRQNRLQRFGIRQRRRRGLVLQSKSHQGCVQPALRKRAPGGRGFPRHVQPFAVLHSRRRASMSEKTPCSKAVVRPRAVIFSKGCARSNRAKVFSCRRKSGRMISARGRRPLSVNPWCAGQERQPQAFFHFLIRRLRRLGHQHLLRRPMRITFLGCDGKTAQSVHV